MDSREERERKRLPDGESKDHAFYKSDRSIFFVSLEAGSFNLILTISVVTEALFLSGKGIKLVYTVPGVALETQGRWMGDM